MRPYQQRRPDDEPTGSWRWQVRRAMRASVHELASQIRGQGEQGAGSVEAVQLALSAAGADSLRQFFSRGLVRSRIAACLAARR